MPRNIGQLLTDNDKKEQLSQVYLRAVATVCGYTVSEPELDRDSIDLIVMSGGRRRASVGFQLKATAGPTWDGDVLKFQLKKKNYNDLSVQRQVPALLAVMVLPREPSEWLDITEAELVLKQCMWWFSLIGQEETQQGSIQVHIPKANVLSVDALAELVDRSENDTL